MNTITNVSEQSSQSPLPDRPGAQGRTRQIVLGSVVVVAVAMTIGATQLLGARKPVEQPAHKPVLTVSVTEASLKPIEKTLSVHGTISAWDPVSVGATTSGLEVKQILADEGDLVKKGQVLAVLDSSTLRAQLDSEKARLASSLANVGKSIQPNRQEDLNALAAVAAQSKANVMDAEAGLVQAQANFENAQINFKRYQELQKEGAVSPQETETRETNCKVADATARSARQRVEAAKFLLTQANEKLSMARSGGRKEDIDIANANVAEIKGNVRRLQTEIDQTVIKSPVNGLIVRRDGHLGDISALGKTMFAIARDNRLELKAQIPQTDLQSVRPGQSVTIEANNADSAAVVGRVREISPLVDADTRLATVRIDLPSDSRLKPGLYAEGHITLGQIMALSVPPKAVIFKDEKSTVFVLHDNQVEARTITTGSRNNEAQEIVSGIQPGDKIVTDGAGFLKDGDYVAVSQ